MEGNGLRNLAKERWMMLKNVLLDRTSPPVPSRSSRLHNRLPLFDIKEVSDSQESFSWQQYTFEDSSRRVFIRNPPKELSTEDLLADDNTGNICIWASEQVMAHFCAKNMHLFAEKGVIEIGGGFSCLAGTFISKYGRPSQVYLTDGNQKALVNMEHIIKKNDLENTRIARLRWDDTSTFTDLCGQFDYLLCADCLFENSRRKELAKTVFKLLKHNGEAFIFAPKRGGTFQAFETHVKCLFGSCNVSVISNYDDKMWLLHESKLKYPSYDEDVHYPLLLRLKKCEKSDAVITAARYA